MSKLGMLRSLHEDRLYTSRIKMRELRAGGLREKAMCHCVWVWAVTDIGNMWGGWNGGDIQWIWL